MAQRIFRRSRICNGSLEPIDSGADSITRSFTTSYPADQCAEGGRLAEHQQADPEDFGRGPYCGCGARGAYEDRQADLPRGGGEFDAMRSSVTKFPTPGTKLSATAIAEFGSRLIGIQNIIGAISTSMTGVSNPWLPGFR